MVFCWFPTELRSCLNFGTSQPVNETASAPVKVVVTVSRIISSCSGDLGVPSSQTRTLVNTWIIGRLSNSVDSQDVEESS
uniref:Uncharacterized protein n=1 Tax=Helianthus annuus TaxID=4232 RepID=A0A251S293_HELAN